MALAMAVATVETLALATTDSNSRDVGVGNNNDDNGNDVDDGDGNDDEKRDMRGEKRKKENTTINLFPTMAPHSPITLSPWRQAPPLTVFLTSNPKILK